MSLLQRLLAACVVSALALGGIACQPANDGGDTGDGNGGVQTDGNGAAGGAGTDDGDGATGENGGDGSGS